MGVNYDKETETQSPKVKGAKPENQTKATKVPVIKKISNIGDLFLD